MNLKETQYKMAPRILEMIKELKETLINQNNITRILIFGSYARGEETPDSDLDLLILVRNEDKQLEEEILKIAYDVMWKYDFNPLFSVQILTEEYFHYLRDVDSSFYKNIEKEGIEV